MGINMAQDKVQTNLELECPKSRKKVQASLGFVTFYYDFIKDISKVAKPVMDTISK
jgi:hypothetical protein